MERVIEQELHKNAAVITKVSETASKEFAIESALDKMQGAWAAVKLNTEEYRETGPLLLSNEICWWKVFRSPVRAKTEHGECDRIETSTTLSALFLSSRQKMTKLCFSCTTEPNRW